MSVKPILFNTDMVRAIQSGIKTATRRVVKGASPEWDSVGIEERLYEQRIKADGEIYPKELDWPHAVFSAGDGYCDFPMIKLPYRPGDILYVRETWCLNNFGYHYRADWPGDNDPGMSADDKWRPSIHMPREAARIFLRVTDVWVERLQDITEGQAVKEGAGPAFEYNTPEGPIIVFDEDGYYGLGFKTLWDGCYAAPRPVKGKGGVIGHYESYPWADINETRTYKGKPWYVMGNPWVWVTEFERVGREEALAHDVLP